MRTLDAEREVSSGVTAAGLPRLSVAFPGTAALSSSRAFYAEGGK